MGTMGSGKTTAAKLLAEKLKFHLIEENFGENAFLPRFYLDMKRWAFHSQTFFLMGKISQLLTVPSTLKRSSVVQDTLLEQDVFSYGQAQHVFGNMDQAEWRLFQKIYHSFEAYLPKPALLIYLETSVPVLVKRIKNRGRSFENDIQDSYVELLDSLNHRWLEENRKIPVLKIDTDGLNIVTSKRAQETLVEKVRDTLKLKL